MGANDINAVARFVAEHEREILAEWFSLLKAGGSGLQTGRLKEGELQTQCTTLLSLFREALAKGETDLASSAFEGVRGYLGEISRLRAIHGISSSETARFVFSLKQSLFHLLSRADAADQSVLLSQAWPVLAVVDDLGLYAIEVYQKSREEVIVRQQREIAELSTPVVKLWKGVLALPVIGTLDSERTQVVMENLLQSIVEEEAEIAIIDITGVPTVDTLTAQYLLKTVAAARLMGADCIISGIRPQIAQTIVHLGVDLNVVTKSKLSDALSIALKRVGCMVVKVKAATASPVTAAE
jgi:rsbT co-antagonist protein RsbR